MVNVIIEQGNIIDSYVHRKTPSISLVLGEKEKGPEKYRAFKFMRS
jgi:hypothetical protein